MGKIARQTREEFKRLPLMLGKVMGGIGAVIGSMLVVTTMTRTSEAPSDIMSPLLIGGAGLAIFLLSDYALKKSPSSTVDESTIAERKQVNVLSWTLFLMLVLMCLGATYLLPGRTG